MNASTRMKMLGVVAGVAAAVAVASPAQALSSYGTVEATFTNVRYPATGTGGVFAFNRGPAGTFAGQLLGGTPTGNFIGICLEVGETVSTSSVTYTVRDLQDAPQRTPATTMGSTRADDIRKLVTLAFNGTLKNALTATATTVYAFQIALWEISTDRTNGPGDYSLVTTGAGGDFTSGNSAISNVPDAVTKNAAITKANEWLVMLNNKSNTIARADNLFAMTRGAGTESQAQDMLVEVVPIPAAAWLLGSGLLGLFGLARRKKAAAAA